MCELERLRVNTLRKLPYGDLCVREEQAALVDRTGAWRPLAPLRARRAPCSSNPPRCWHRTHSIAVHSSFKLRVVTPEVSILPEDLEELYDLFKVGNWAKGGVKGQAHVVGLPGWVGEHVEAAESATRLFSGSRGRSCPTCWPHLLLSCLWLTHESCALLRALGAGNPFFTVLHGVLRPEYVEQ